MKKISSTIFIICFFQLLFAQQETNYWYFGFGAGLDFTGGTPTVISAAGLNADEGCASISDSMGNFLFYTNGVTVWNKNYQVMTNGTGLWGDYSTTQSAIIVPQPLSDSLYYIFTVDYQAGYWGGYGGIAYSIVDMSLQGGNGEVIIKNVPLLTPTAEKLAAVKHSNGTDVWIITQHWGSNLKYAWLITSSGLNVTPIISNIGTVQNWTGNFNARTQGYMKFSTDGSKLGSVIGPMGIIEVFDFNNSSGVVSNLITINVLDGLYGLEFSPDHSRLYSTTWSSKILQWDLTLGSQVLINNSQTLIHQTPFSPTMHITLGLQLGIDCRIYVTIDGLDSLGLIQNPNQLGLSCNYVHNAISLQGNSSTPGLPNFIQSYFNGCNTVGINSITPQHSISISPNPATNKITISNPQSAIEAIEIYNVVGQRVFSQLQTANYKLQTVTIDVSTWNKGIYFVKASVYPDLIGNGEKQVVKKVVVQ